MNPPPHTPPRIAIIGGGISGLAAAYRLTELLPHVELKLFEASERLGGVLDTAQFDGFLVERSADNFLTQPATAVDLCRRVGLADELLPTNETHRRAFVVRGNQLLSIPDGFYLMSPRKLAPFLASPLLSWRGKLRLLAEPFVSRGNDADESVASFARRRLGREAYERLVQPLVAGIYTADPEQLSMAATMPQFAKYEREHGSLLRATLHLPWRGAKSARRTGYFRDQPTADASGALYSLFAAPKNGMSSLVHALASRLPSGAIELNTPVISLSRQPDYRWRLDLGSRISANCEAGGSPSQPESRTTRFAEAQYVDAVIVATPAHSAAKLLDTCHPALAVELSAIPYAGCVVVSFGFTGCQFGRELNGFGLVVPHVEGRKIIAASFASQKFPGRSPKDSILIRVFLGGALQPELLQFSDADLRNVAFAEITSLLRITGEPQLTDIARWPHAMPQYHVGHLDRAARIEELLTGWPGLALAGNAYHGVGIPHCISSGEAAAEQIAKSLRSVLPVT